MSDIKYNNYAELIADKKKIYNDLLKKVSDGEINAYDAIIKLNENNNIERDINYIKSNKLLRNNNLPENSNNEYDNNANNQLKKEANVDEINQCNKQNQLNQIKYLHANAKQNTKYLIKNELLLNDYSLHKHTNNTNNTHKSCKTYISHNSLSSSNKYNNLHFTVEKNNAITINGLNRKYPITMHYIEWKILQQYLNNELDKFHEVNK